MKIKQFGRFFIIMCALAAVAYLLGARITFPKSASSTSGKPRLELLVGGTTPYWQSVIIGARKAAEDHNSQLTIRVPQRDGRDQTRHLVMIDTDQVDGVAISPLFPDDQTRVLSALAADINVVTFGNDLPQSLRQYYIGTDNQNAGRLAADLVKEAMPEGGKLALFIGDGTREVARTRLFSFYHNLLETGQTIASVDDPIPAAGKNEKFTILNTYFDERDTAKATENANEALSEYPDLQCMVCLYGYNAPSCLKALESAGKTGEVKVVAFDAYEATLKGIETDKVFASVIQDSYMYGYEAVRILAALHRGEIDKAPPIAQRSTLTLPCKPLKKDGVAEFRKSRSERLKQLEQKPAASPAKAS